MLRTRYPQDESMVLGMDTLTIQPQPRCTRRPQARTPDSSLIDLKILPTRKLGDHCED